MAIKLTHETAPDIARRIVESGEFAAGPFLGDAGLNACIEGVAYNPDQAARTGAFVDFEWTGPIKLGAHAEHEPNVLYDNRPYRAFVFVCTNRHLRLADVRFSTGFSWRDAVDVPSRPAGGRLLSASAWYAWMLSRSPEWLDEASTELERAMLARLAKKPPISIVPPEDCPYLYDLRVRGLI